MIAVKTGAVQGMKRPSGKRTILETDSRRSVTPVTSGLQVRRRVASLNNLDRDQLLPAIRNFGCVAVVPGSRSHSGGHGEFAAVQ